jgi:hypothetical protein
MRATVSEAEQFVEEYHACATARERITILLEAATRAPSTHNSQPWRFSVGGDDLVVHKDSGISLPYSDPAERYAHISIGILLHHLTVAAAAIGQVIEVAPQGNAWRATFRSGELNDVLLPAIFSRRNRRGEFVDKPIVPDLLARACNSSNLLPDFLKPVEVKTVTRREDTRTMGVLVRTVMSRLYRDPAFRAEMAAWVTPTGSSRKDGIPGYSVNVPTLISWILPTLIRLTNPGRRLGALNERAISSAAALIGFAGPDGTDTWLAAGFQASHAMLTLASQGVDTSVFVAAIEQPDTREEATQLFGFSRPLQFHFAAGYLPPTREWRTPRIPVRDKIEPI